MSFMDRFLRVLKQKINNSFNKINLSTCKLQGSWKATNKYPPELSVKRNRERSRVL